MASAYVCEIRTPGPQAMGTENPVLIRMLIGSLNGQYGCFFFIIIKSLYVQLLYIHRIENQKTILITGEKDKSL